MTDEAKAKRAGELLRRYAAVLLSKTDRQKTYNYTKLRTYMENVLKIDPVDLYRFEDRLHSMRFAVEDELSEA